MKLYKFERREIRSFRLREKILNLKTFFESSTQLGVFIMTDLIQPEDRIFVKNQISKLDVSFMYISKNTIEL
jgi:hypothetical protein